MEDSETLMEMPKYRSHKTVWALKITGIEPQAEDGTAGLLCETPDGQKGRIVVTREYQKRHAPAVGGYYVRYADGYESFSPAAPFEEGYTLLNALKLRDFGWAIIQLKAGRRVRRSGWNGKGMYLWLLPAAMVQAGWCREEHLKAVAEANGGEIEALGSIRMMTADKKVLTGWLASQTDILSEDWELVE
jgi:hypothetical protein